MEITEALEVFDQHIHLTDAVSANYCRRIKLPLQIREDVHSEAHMGLWEACLRYDPSKNSKFWPFAYLRIRGSIIEVFRREGLWLRGRQIKAGMKNVHFESLTTHPSSVHHSEDGGAYWFRHRKEADMIDESSKLDIERIEVAMIINSGTSGMPQYKKEIMTKYYCDGLPVSEMGVSKQYAWAAIREGTKELRTRKVMK